MEWQDMCDSPLFKDLPSKVETNRWGHILMTAASNERGLFRARITEWLAKLGTDGYALTSCSVKTNQGTKVADVGWGSAGFFRRNGAANPYPVAPEIVVEILSSRGSQAEMDEKRDLYFTQGASECWLCEPDGNMRFFSSRDEMRESKLIPGFPHRIEIDFI